MGVTLPRSTVPSQQSLERFPRAARLLGLEVGQGGKHCAQMAADGRDEGFNKEMSARFSSSPQLTVLQRIVADD